MAESRRPPEPPELRRLRARIDALDRRIVKLLNERAELAREAGLVKESVGRRAIRDLERERDILIRIAVVNVGPMPQADLLAMYRRLFAATRSLERRDRDRRARDRREAGRRVVELPRPATEPPEPPEPTGSTEPTDAA